MENNNKKYQSHDPQNFSDSNSINDIPGTPKKTNREIAENCIETAAKNKQIFFVQRRPYYKYFGHIRNEFKSRGWLEQDWINSVTWSWANGAQKENHCKRLQKQRKKKAAGLVGGSCLALGNDEDDEGDDLQGGQNLHQNKIPDIKLLKPQSDLKCPLLTLKTGIF